MPLRTTMFGFTLIIMALVLGACGISRRPSPEPDTASNQVSPSATEPVYRYSQLMPRDGIRPIYEPDFIRAEVATLVDDQLVLGVARNGFAKAYPIAVLNSREMVNDELGDLPILVTW